MTNEETLLFILVGFVITYPVIYAIVKYFMEDDK